MHLLAQGVSEGLSQHVLRNYAQFVAGIAEVSALEADLITAHVCSKVLYQQLCDDVVCYFLQCGCYLAMLSCKAQGMPPETCALQAA